MVEPDVADEPFAASALTEQTARACASRLGLDLSQDGELEFLLSTSSVDVQAAPGSGKTSLVGLKLCMLASAWTAEDRGVCVLSHTNTAKNQIRTILERDSVGCRLLSYPHFVGTIQTFVDTFLGLPHLRSAGIDVRSVDDDVYRAAALRALARRSDLQQLRASMGRLANGDDLIGSASFCYQDGGVTIQPATAKWPFGPDVASTKQYRRLKQLMREEGRFRYADMFAFALQQLADSPAIGAALRRRFPVLIIDEMQDTSQQQHDVLTAIVGSGGCIVQRIGDENQRIYDSAAGGHESTFPLDGHVDLRYSRRFGPKIASVASKLTVKTPQLIAPLGDEATDHLVLVLFDSASSREVIPTFGRLVEARVPKDLFKKHPIKAVGGRRDAEAGQSSVGGISAYGCKPPPASASSQPRTFADAVVRVRTDICGAGHTFGCWRLLFRSLHELVVLNGFTIEGRRPSPRELEQWLTDQGEETVTGLRAVVRDLVFASDVTEAVWQQATLRIKELLGEATDAKQWNEDTESFLSFSPELSELSTTATSNGDEVEAVGIIVDTIHNVKGETHAATLVLECKNSTGKMNDLREVMMLLSGDMDAKRQARSTVQRICQLAFVAATRPVACLGFAVAKEDAAPYLDTLAQQGWEIVDVTTGIGDGSPTSPQGA